ncbi:MAG: thiamine pyrophosphate-binding protein [Candidatus Omnitrophica bacterium]|nr:thiamine pyrophosphate-binding protein [Candidatus Omnitrophota bacterium]
MKFSDYVIDFLASKGVKHFFGVTGGAVVHFFDSIDKNKQTVPVFCHHEQAAALAAVSYARVSNNFGATIVTTGPGGTNAITGVAAAWQDSIPCIFISGQARKEHTTYGKPLRQLGTQELNIIPIVKPITKYAVMVEKAEDIRYHLEKAVYLAKEGRPGPVWIDIPLNFQWSMIQPEKLRRFVSNELGTKHALEKVTAEGVKQLYTLLAKSKRPLFLVGYGVRLSRAEKELGFILKTFKIPFVSSWQTADIFPTDAPRYIGRPGLAGQRGANFAVQNCDLLIVLGSHLSPPLTGTNFKYFARGAKVVVIDADQDALNYRTVKIDLPICCDVKGFLLEMKEKIKSIQMSDIRIWQQQCTEYRRYNQVPREWYDQKSFVNPYVFMDLLSDLLEARAVIVVDGGGTNVYVSFQALRVKKRQRLCISAGICAMGTGLPESVGASFANPGSQIVCLTGDGSMQFNIHELQTIVHHRLNVKIFVFNNDGYLAIRHTQQGFLDGRFVGSNKEGGLSLPDFKKIANAYGMVSVQIRSNRDLRKKIDDILSRDGPVVCELMVSPKQEVVPCMGFTKNSDGTFTPRPLEDLYPFLEREEFFRNMLVEPCPESKKRE